MTTEQPLTGARHTPEAEVSPAAAVGALLGIDPVEATTDEAAVPSPGASGERPRAGRTRPGAGEVVEARQVTRVIRHIEPWSVARMAFAFSLALWLILVVASVIIWQVASATGAIDHIESFMAQLLADQSFTVDGGQLLRASAISGVVLVVAGTAFTVLLALLFNLICELTGGLRLRVIEVETARRRPS